MQHPTRPPRAYTKALALCALALTASSLAWGCRSSDAKGDAEGAPAAVAAQGAGTAPGAHPRTKTRGETSHKLRGAVLLDDRWVPVAPFVGHDAHMDLYVQCKAARDRAQAAGKPAPPLCYEDARVNKPTHLRIEHAEGRSGADAMRALRRAEEGAHLLIESNGSIRQVLDLAYPPRRAGSNRRGEIRVLSGNRAAQETLAAALRQAFPGLTVETVEVGDAPATKPQQAAKPQPSPGQGTAPSKPPTKEPTP